MPYESYSEQYLSDFFNQRKVYSYSCDHCSEVQQISLKSEVNPYAFKPYICPNNFCREKENFSLIQLI